MNRTIARGCTYAAREEAGVHRPARTRKIRSGPGRDFATLLIEACHFLGLPARFVSDYASTQDMPAALGATQAWTAVFLPGAGWNGFDSTGDSVGGPKTSPSPPAATSNPFHPIAGVFFGDLGHVDSALTVEVVVPRRN